MRASFDRIDTRSPTVGVLGPPPPLNTPQPASGSATSAAANRKRLFSILFGFLACLGGRCLGRGAACLVRFGAFVRAGGDGVDAQHPRHLHTARLQRLGNIGQLGVSALEPPRPIELAERQNGREPVRGRVWSSGLLSGGARLIKRKKKK